MKSTKTELHASSYGHYADHFGQTGGDYFKMTYYEDTKDKVGWIQPIPARLSPGTLEENTVPSDLGLTSMKYTIDTPYKFLVGSVMGIPVPSFKIKEEYSRTHRIKLVDYFTAKISPKAEFGTSETVVYNLDTEGHIIINEKLLKSGYDTTLNKHAGALTLTKDWVTEIKGKTLYAKQPWLYSFSPGKAFPLYALRKMDAVAHRYYFRLLSNKHLMMSKFNEDTCEWDIVPLDMSLLVNPVSTFPVPILYGLFSNVSPAEMEKRTRMKLDTFKILDMITLGDSAKYGPGSVITYDINDFGGLLQVVFWMLKNVTYEKLNITSNYTSDCVERPESESALVSNKMSTKDSVKFSDLPSALFEGVLSPYTFLKGSEKSGILAYNTVEKTASGNNGGSKAQSLGLSLSCVVSSDVHANDRYTLVVRCLVQKTMKIENGVIIITQD